MESELSEMVCGATARLGATMLQSAFEKYTSDFQIITRRSKARFENREWKMVLLDAEERIGLYHHHLSLTEALLRPLMGGEVHSLPLWAQIKTGYLELYRERYDSDLALIFFYSVMRRLFAETGKPIEYSDDEIRQSAPAQIEQDPNRPVRIYPADRPEDVTPGLLRRIVRDFRFRAPYHDLEHDVRLAVEMLRPELKQALGNRGIDRIEMLESAFYRNKAAYLMGRVISGRVIVPLVLVLLNPPEGIVIDTALCHETDLGHIFTSARSNFHTATDHYREVLQFLESIAPSRPKAYIYTAIGFIHPGKLQLVHELRRHLAETGEVFRVARGVPGTVMIVFELPAFGYVFKTIREVSAKPTFLGRDHVIAQYWRVHRTDRVGRMLDIMSFHNLRFHRSDFHPCLLDELLAAAPGTVWTEGGDVVFRFLYAQRQITPLDVYLASPSLAEPAKAEAAVDYGYALKDIAAAGIFVGDYLPKNFGVNRLGRVMLYDYDDIEDLILWNFRKLPEPPEWAETLSYDDWLSKGERDVFPEHDFRIFSTPAHGGTAFFEHHADLLQPGFWNAIKSELKAGNVPEYYPYPPHKRLRSRCAESEPRSRHVRGGASEANPGVIG